MMRGAFAIAVGLMCAALAAAASVALAAPPPEELVVTGVQGEPGAVVTVTVSVPGSVRSRALGTGELSVTEGNERVETAVARLPLASVGVVVVVDTAGDVAPATLLAQQAAAVELVRALDPAMAVVLATSAGGLVAGPTTDRTVTLRALATLEPQGARANVAAISAGADAFRATGGITRTEVVVFAAGADTGAVDAPPPLSALPTTAVRWLTLAPQATPPAAVPATTVATSPATVLAAVDRVVHEVTSQYQLSFRPRTGADLSAQLTVDGTRWTTPIALAGADRPEAEAPATTAPTSSTAQAPATTAAVEEAPVVAASSDTDTATDDTDDTDDVGGPLVIALVALVGLVALGVGGALFATRTVRTQPAPPAPALPAPVAVATPADGAEDHHTASGERTIARADTAGYRRSTPAPVTSPPTANTVGLYRRASGRQVRWQPTNVASSGSYRRPRSSVGSGGT